jgi:hypothetical protein
VGTLVDAQGNLAFALSSGDVGALAPSGSVDVVNDVCARFSNGSPLAALGVHPAATFAGIAPAAPSAMIVACGSGVVARVDSDFAHVR